MPKRKLPSKKFNSEEIRSHPLLRDHPTKRERAFIDAIAEGLSVAIAGELIGLKNVSSAYKVMRRPRVVRYLEEALKRSREEQLKETAKKASRTILSLKLADDRLFELLSAKRVNPLDALRAEIIAKSRSKPEKKLAELEALIPPPTEAQPAEAESAKHEDIPVDDKTLARAIDLAYRRKGGYPASVSGGTVQQINAERVEFYQSAWLSKSPQGELPPASPDDDSEDQ